MRLHQIWGLVATSTPASGLGDWPQGHALLQALLSAHGLIADNPRMATKKPKGLGLGLEALLGPRVKEAGDDSAPADRRRARTH